MSVATVSRSVARLEDRLGGRLINRTSRRLALTDLGRTLADRAARLYTDAEDAVNLARETSSQPRGVVRLAVPMSFGVRWVAPILPDYLPILGAVTLMMEACEAAGQIETGTKPADFLMLLQFLWQTPPASDSVAQVERLFGLLFRGLGAKD